MDTDLLTVSEVAQRLKVKKSWVYRHAGELGAYNLRKYVRFSWERVLEHLKRGLPSSEPDATEAEAPSSTCEISEPGKGPTTGRS